MVTVACQNLGAPQPPPAGGSGSARRVGTGGGDGADALEAGRPSRGHVSVFSTLLPNTLNRSHFMTHNSEVKDTLRLSFVRNSTVAVGKKKHLTV